MMTIQEVFESPAVKSVEFEILDVMSEVIGKWRDPQCKIAVQHLLTVRKNILNKMFVLTDEYKKLLEEFNDKLIDALLEMRSQTITMHNGALNADMYGVNTTGKVFMGYKYPAIHPIQIARAKKIWAVLMVLMITLCPCTKMELLILPCRSEIQKFLLRISYCIFLKK